MPLAHTVELNAATVDTDAGPHLHATWTWAPSALDHDADQPAQPTVVRRPGRHLRPRARRRRRADPVRHRPGPADPSSRSTSCSSSTAIADVLPLTPLQQGLLFHASTAQAERRRVRGAARHHRDRSARPDRLRDAVHTVVNRHPNLAARFCEQFDQPVQIIPADPAAGVAVPRAGRRRRRSREQIQRVCAAERAAVCDLADAAGLPGGVDPHRATDRHRFVLTNHHIVLDGWSLPILLREIFAGYYGQRLPAAAPYRSFVTWLADRDLDAAHAAWREVLAGFDTPTLVGPPDRLGLGRRGVESIRVSAETTRALGELARSCHTTVNTVLQAAWAQLLMWLTGQHDVAFGTAVSGRPAEVAGADSMVGLLINTVPVRARHHAGHHHRRPARPTANAPTTTRSTTSTWRSARSTASPATTSCSTPCSCTRTTRSTPPRSSGDHELAITEFTSREYNHYPLTVQAMPGTRTGPSRRIRHRRVRRRTASKR